VRRVAFMSGGASRHTVLPALACTDLVMANDPDRKRVGSIGEVLKGRGEPDKVERTAYDEVAARTISRALVFKMIYRTLEIHKVKLPDGSIRYRDQDEMENSKDGGQDLGQPEGIGPGEADYDAERAHRFGLCKAICNDPGAVVRAYRLPRRVLTEVWIGDRATVAGLIEVHGRLDKG